MVFETKNQISTRPMTTANPCDPQKPTCTALRMSVVAPTLFEAGSASIVPSVVQRQVNDLDAHVEGHLDPEQRENNEAEPRPLAGVDAPVAPGSPAAGRGVPVADQPEDAREADDEDRGAVEDDGDIRVALRHPEAQH